MGNKKSKEEVQSTDEEALNNQIKKLLQVHSEAMKKQGKSESEISAEILKLVNSSLSKPENVSIKFEIEGGTKKGGGSIYEGKVLISKNEDPKFAPNPQKPKPQKERKQKVVPDKKLLSTSITGNRRVAEDDNKDKHGDEERDKATDGDKEDGDKENDGAEDEIKKNEVDENEGGDSNVDKKDGLVKKTIKKIGEGLAEIKKKGASGLDKIKDNSLKKKDTGKLGVRSFFNIFKNKKSNLKREGDQLEQEDNQKIELIEKIETTSVETKTVPKEIIGETEIKEITAPLDVGQLAGIFAAVGVVLCFITCLFGVLVYRWTKALQASFRTEDDFLGESDLEDPPEGLGDSQLKDFGLRIDAVPSTSDVFPEEAAQARQSL